MQAWRDISSQRLDRNKDRKEIDTYLHWPPPTVIPGVCGREGLVLGCPKSSVPWAHGQTHLSWAGREIPWIIKNKIK